MANQEEAQVFYEAIDSTLLHSKTTMEETLAMESDKVKAVYREMGILDIIDKAHNDINSLSHDEIDMARDKLVYMQKALDLIQLQNYNRIMGMDVSEEMQNRLIDKLQEKYDTFTSMIESSRKLLDTWTGGARGGGGGGEEEPLGGIPSEGGLGEATPPADAIDKWAEFFRKNNLDIINIGKNNETNYKNVFLLKIKE